MRKRKLSIYVTAALFILILLCTPAYASSSGQCGDDLSWTLNDSGVLTVSGTGAMWRYDQSSMWPRNEVKKVVINNGVTTIGVEAFYGSADLTEITISGSVVGIGSNAFYNCQGLTELVLPNNLREIGPGAFSRCTGLTSMLIPDKTVTIGTYLFSNCTNLTDVTIPDSVTNVGDHIFLNCQGIRTVGPIGGDYDCKIGWTQMIPKDAFFGCNHLTGVTLPEGITSIDSDAFFDCTGLTSVTIPGSVTSIGEAAFCNCSHIVSLTLPENISYIGESAFQGCARLKKITIPGNLSSISGELFMDCRSLKSVTIQDGITSIGYRAFYGCSSLTGITIPGSVTSMGDNAFYGCSSLADVTIPESLTSIHYEPFKGCTSIHTAGPVGGDYDYKYAWSSSIPANAFGGCSSLTEITIPSDVTSIGERAFFGCEKLVSITLPDGLTSISDYLFFDCSSLKGVRIPSGVTGIGKYAFKGSGIRTLSIPGSVRNIGGYTFSECHQLGSVYFNGDAPSIFKITFPGISVDAYYPGGNQTWTSSVMQNYFGTIEWIANTGPFIDVQPSDLVVLPNRTVSFKVLAQGDVKSYQWEYSTDGVTWTNCSSSGADTASFSFKTRSGFDGRMYRCKVSDGSGLTYSVPAELTVVSIVSQPQSKEIDANETVTFSVSAKGAVGYQWQYSDNGSVWKDCRSEGYDTASLSFKALESLHNRQYRCIIHNGSISVTSEAARLTIKGMPLAVLSITSQPEAQTVESGQTAAFSVRAENASGYRWQFSKNGGSTWTNCTAATSDTDTFTFTAASAYSGRIYRCRVTDSNGIAVFSEPAELTVRAAGPKITSQPEDITAVNGASASFEVSASGTGLKYRWQFSKNGGSTWTNCTAATSDTDTFTFTAASSYSGRLYRCRVTDSSGKSVFSDAVELTVRAAGPKITSQPDDVIAVNGETAFFKVSASGTGLKYQWQLSKNGGSTWTNCTAASSDTDTFTFTAASAYSGRIYRCRVTDANGNRVFSDAAELTVRAAGPKISSQPEAQTVSAGSRGTFRVTASGTDLSYQWQYSKNGTSWTDCSSAGSDTAVFSFKAGTVHSGRLYRCVVSDANGSTASQGARLTVE